MASIFSGELDLLNETRVCRLYGPRDVRIEAEQLPPLAGDEVLVANEHGGICGSDLHYYQKGGFGPIRVRQPIILGHEIAGHIAGVGKEVRDFKIGDVVAVNPSQPCHACSYCYEELFQHCTSMKFMGSARQLPHTQGVFREFLVVKANQCIRYVSTMDTRLAACTEPLAVCIHAQKRVGDLTGKRVLVSGAGPIGLLCVAVVVTSDPAALVVTDIKDVPLDLARDVGAQHTINMARKSSELADYVEDRGYFDVAFECSAATEAIRSSLEAVRPCGIIVQIGVAGSTEIPVNLLVGKEINLIGSHRFHGEFAEAARMIDEDIINVRPIITHNFALDQVSKALDVAGDCAVSAKVQIRFSDAPEYDDNQ